MLRLNATGRGWEIEIPCRLTEEEEALVANVLANATEEAAARIEGGRADPNGLKIATIPAPRMPDHACTDPDCEECP